jgi:ATP-binding cassette subfamily B protein
MNQRLLWPADRLTDAVDGLVRAAALADRRTGRDAGPSGAPAGIDADRVIRRSAAAADVDAEAVSVAYGDVEDLLADTGPAIVEVVGAAGPAFLAVARRSRRHLVIAGPDGRAHRVRTAVAAAWLRHGLDRSIAPEIDRLIADTAIPPRAAAATRQAWLNARLAARTAARLWILRSRPEGSWWRQLRETRLVHRLTLFLAAYVGAAAAPVAAWWIMGAAILQGQVSGGTLVAWTLVLVSVVPFAVLALWMQGIVMVGASGLIKQRLLTGALRLDPDETRHAGFGRHLARVIESNALESLALGGGFAAAAAMLDLAFAAVVFGMARAWWHLAALALLALLFAAGAAAYVSRRRAWTDRRMSLTDGLVERMIGHRTRLVQEAPSGRHVEEDAALEAYLAASRRLDRIAVLLSAMPRVWLGLGLAVAIPSFVDDGATMTSLAMLVGATLLGYAAFAKLAGGLAAIGDAAISWRQVQPLLARVRAGEPAGDPAIEAVPGTATRPLIVARDLTYRLPRRPEAILSGCSFDIARGDRIHLTAPSGGGKSTLVSIVAGLRTATSGLVLVNGLDRATLGGRGWRAAIAAAPQFHENHLFNDSLAFNLLLARRWPPTAADLSDAELVCHRLQLGELLERMPAGLFTPVGETGWQLSHGERSRVFMARAVLQDADLVMLDESFAELDPDSLERCLPEMADLANTLLVVAHR